MTSDNRDFNLTDVDPQDLLKLARLLGESLAVLDRGYFSTIVFNLKDALALAEEIHKMAYGQGDIIPLFDYESE